MIPCTEHDVPKCIWYNLPWLLGVRYTNIGTVLVMNSIFPLDERLALIKQIVDGLLLTDVPTPPLSLSLRAISKA